MCVLGLSGPLVQGYAVMSSGRQGGVTWGWSLAEVLTPAALKMCLTRKYGTVPAFVCVCQHVSLCVCVCVCVRAHVCVSMVSGSGQQLYARSVLH